MFKKSLILLLLTVAIFSYANRIIYPEVLPQAIIHPDPVSRSQWIWNADTAVKNHAVSYFRMTLDLPEKVVFAYLNVKFDDSGFLFINGRKTNAENFSTYLKKGKNVIAFELKNAFGPSGMIFLGEIELASGKKITVHSDKSVKASGVKYPDWHTVAFDDSRWKAARTMGDCTAAPWANYGYYVDDFTTEAEKKKYDSEIAAANRLPAGLEKEAAPKVRIVYRGNTPMILINGKQHPVLWNLCGGDAGNMWGDNIILKTSKIGFDFFQVTVSPEILVKGAGNYDFRSLNKKITRLLTLVPNAKILINIRMGTAIAWSKAHPDENIQYAAGAVDTLLDEYQGRALRPSAASKVYRQDTLKAIRGLSQYIKSQPWKNRVIGFRSCWGIYTEWHCFGMFQAPDTGKAMTREFRKYLARKYKTEAALQKAWGEKNVTFATAKPPTTAERTNNASLLDPVKNRKYIDFSYCLQETIADLLLLWSAELKKEFPDRLCGAYYGYIFTGHTPEGANILVDKVLSSPYIDFLSNPSYYSPSCRQAGGTYHHRAIPASFKRYGKLVTIDDDSRYHFLPGITEAYATRSALESIMCTRRNYCNHIFDNSAIQLTDPMRGRGSRPHAFDNKDVLDALSESIKVVRNLGVIPSESRLDSAVVVNYYDRLYRDGAKKLTPLMFNLFALGPIHSLRSGMAFEILTLQDYLASSKDYKNVIFLSCFAPTAEERAKLMKKTRQPRTNAVWLIAPGCITENGFSDAAMSELAGIKLAGSGVAPRVICKDKAAVQICKNIYRKTLESKANMYFVDQIPRNSSAWRELFTAVGMHAYVPADNYFRRHNHIFMFHTGKVGKYKIELPAEYKNCTVTEQFSGKTYKASAIEVVSTGPGTWLFTINK